MIRHLKFLALLGPLALLCALIYSGPAKVSAQVMGQKGPGWCGNPEFQQLSIPIAQATQNADTQIITAGATSMKRTRPISRASTTRIAACCFGITPARRRTRRGRWIRC